MTLPNIILLRTLVPLQPFHYVIKYSVQYFYIILQTKIQKRKM